VIGAPIQAVIQSDRPKAGAKDLVAAQWLR
jgi:hypothetical protein